MKELFSYTEVSVTTSLTITTLLTQHYLVSTSLSHLESMSDNIKVNFEVCLYSLKDHTFNLFSLNNKGGLYF